MKRKPTAIFRSIANIVVKGYLTGRIECELLNLCRKRQGRRLRSLIKNTFRIQIIVNLNSRQFSCKIFPILLSYFLPNSQSFLTLVQLPEKRIQNVLSQIQSGQMVFHFIDLFHFKKKEFRGALNPSHVCHYPFIISFAYFSPYLVQCLHALLTFYLV